MIRKKEEEEEEGILTDLNNVIYKNSIQNKIFILDIKKIPMGKFEIKAISQY